MFGVSGSISFCHFYLDLLLPSSWLSWLILLHFDPAPSHLPSVGDPVLEGDQVGHLVELKNSCPSVLPEDSWPHLLWDRARRFRVLVALLRLSFHDFLGFIRYPLLPSAGQQMGCQKPEANPGMSPRPQGHLDNMQEATGGCVPPLIFWCSCGHRCHLILEQMSVGFAFPKLPCFFI